MTRPMTPWTAPPPPAELVGTREVAQAMRCSQATVTRWCNEGLLPGAFRTLGMGPGWGHWRIPAATLDDLLAGRLDPKEEGTP